MEMSIFAKWHLYIETTPFTTVQIYKKCKVHNFSHSNILQPYFYVLTTSDSAFIAFCQNSKFIQIMAFCQRGNKPLPQPVISIFIDYLIVGDIVPIASKGHF